MKTQVKALIFLGILAANVGFCQVGVDNPTPDPFSILDLKASNKGILIPRMTTAQRFSLRSSCNPSCPTGLLVYDTDKKSFFFMDANNWYLMTPFTSPDINSGSSEVVNTDNLLVSDVGIGTTPAVGYKLDVNGNTQVRGNALVQNDITVQTGNIAVSTGTISANSSIVSNNGNISAPLGNVVASGFSSNITATNVAGPVPKGGIIMWSGSIASIPTGWALCDGANGTPDLRERFVVGAAVVDNLAVNGLPYSVFQNGGEATHALTTAELPAHNHSVSIGSGGAHSHLIYADNGGGGVFSSVHTKNIQAPGDCSNCIMNHEGWTEPAGSHSHTVSESTIGSDTPFDNRPPYYALAFIMKL